MDYFTDLDGHSFRVERAAGAPDFRVHSQDEGSPPREVRLELAPGTGHPIRSVLLGQRSLRVLPHRHPDGRWTLEVEGRRFEAMVLDRGQDAVRRARKESGADDGLTPLRAPMPGMVMRVEVAVGDAVSPGQGLVIVEAMKMENELKAAAPARVSAIHAAAGTAVDKDDVLVEFEALEVEG